MNPLALPSAPVAIDDSLALLEASFDRLSRAAKNAGDLLHQAGLACAAGDTADDLHQAVASCDHLLHQFLVKTRTIGRTDVCTIAASTSHGAYAEAAERQGDAPYSITVTPAVPDLQDLAAAQRALHIAGSLDDALKHPTLRVAMNSWARKHPRRFARTTDFKSLAANDRD